jgi:hypothetical protein
MILQASQNLPALKKAKSINVSANQMGFPDDRGHLPKIIKFSAFNSNYFLGRKVDFMMCFFSAFF